MAGWVCKHRGVLVDRRHRAVVEWVTPASWWVAAAIVERRIGVETPAVEVRIPNPAVRIELEGHSHAGGWRAGQREPDNENWEERPRLRTSAHPQQEGRCDQALPDHPAPPNAADC